MSSMVVIRNMVAGTGISGVFLLVPQEVCLWDTCDRFC